MGFFDKLKSGLGIGGVKVQLEVPGQISRENSSVEGKLVLTSKRDEEVRSITVKMIEEWTTGRGENRKTKEYELGKIVYGNQILIKAGETKEMPFTLDYRFLKSEHDVLKDGKTNFEKGAGALTSFMVKEKSEFFIHAEADVVSAKGLFDPTDKKSVKVV